MTTTPKNYTSEAKLNTFLGETVVSGSANDAMYEATDMIDVLTGRNFLADTVASERLFDGKDKETLLIDDCVEITEVKYGNDFYGDVKTTKSTADYVKLPTNYSSKLAPITGLHIKNAIWPVGIQNHSIKAKWGYSVAVPASIELAATVLAAGIYMFNRGGGSGDMNSESIGNYSVSYKNDEGWKAYKRALTIIAGFKRYTI